MSIILYQEWLIAKPCLKDCSLFQTKWYHCSLKSFFANIPFLLAANPFVWLRGEKAIHGFYRAHTSERSACQGIADQGCLPLKQVLLTSRQIHVMHIRIIIKEFLQQLPHGLHPSCQPHHATLHPPHPLQVVCGHLDSSWSASDSIINQLSQSSQFWLQYCNLDVESGLCQAIGCRISIKASLSVWWQACV